MGLLGGGAGRGGVVLRAGCASAAGAEWQRGAMLLAGVAGSLRPDDSISSVMIMQDRIESSGFLGRSAGRGSVVLQVGVEFCCWGGVAAWQSGSVAEWRCGGLESQGRCVQTIR